MFLFKQVKIELSLPITASNLMFEYEDFYETVTSLPESLQCPRCSATVPANPGVCTNCGEHVFQCHKCKLVNSQFSNQNLINIILQVEQSTTMRRIPSSVIHVDSASMQSSSTASLADLPAQSIQLNLTTIVRRPIMQSTTCLRKQTNHIEKF